MPKLAEKYDNINTIKHAQMKNDKIDNFLKSIKSMGADYIFVVDINNSHCITARKRLLQQKLNNIDINNIIIVIKEIESWYIAGLSKENFKKFKVPYYKNTEEFTKEQLNIIIPKKYNSRIDFMLEILKNYSITIAKKKNSSFNYFIEKYGN